MDDESIEEKRFKKLGFKPQREIIYNKFLPYADKLDDESLKLYTDIKTNVVKSVLLREMRPGCVLWVSRLNKYIKVFGLKFSKEDHIALIKLLYELITIPDLEPTRINKFATTLTLLLKKKELLSRDELELPWRPLHELCERITSSSQTSLGMYRYFSSLETNLEMLVHAARIYFPASATREVLDLWRPKLCPYDANSMSDAVERLEFFLPVAVKPSEANISYELWLDEFMGMWRACHNAPTWETDMLWLIARLAMYNVGYVDWEPHVPIMFTRFLRSLDLPVSYRQKQSQRRHKLETTPMAVWIVSVIGGGGAALEHLDRLVQTVESYYHPANVGRWSARLRELFRKLPYYFVMRLHRERYRVHGTTWELETRASHRLTDHDVDAFVRALAPVVSHVIYSRQATSDVSSGLQHLATLRPAAVVPAILERLYATLDAPTEPHKLTSSLQCLVAVARPLLRGARDGYSEGATHAIPLLAALLPGIDPNDIRKCLVTFQFISTFASMIPLVDCSAGGTAWPDLTDDERVLCEQTAGFEDLVLQFFDRVFTLVQSSALEATRLEQVDADKRSRLEAVAESALSSVCNVIVSQASEKIFRSALRKLHAFVADHVLETKVSGQMVAIMVKSFVRVRPAETLAAFVPRLCARVRDEASRSLHDETLDTELLYDLLILSEMLDCSGAALLPHQEDLVAALDATLCLRCTHGHQMATRLLNHVLISLTFVQPLEYRSAPAPFYEDGTRVSVRDWGAAGDVHDLRVEWYVPGEQEIACAQRLLDLYLAPRVAALELYVADDDAEYSRQDMRQHLAVVLGCLGAQSVLPVWDEPAAELPHVRSLLEGTTNWTFDMVIGTDLTLSMPDGRNVRKTLADLMGRLQTKLLARAEDDTKSFFNLIGIWDSLIMTRYRGRDFESHWKNFHLVKRVLADCLRGGKRHLRPLLIDRVMLQQEFRTESRSFVFTETHRQILIRLYELSTSHYSEVRVRAQKKLFLAVSCFPYAYTTLTPLLKATLRLDSTAQHEQFKGCLYVLLGPKNTPIMARHDWNFVADIWPALVTSMPSEKPSVINLMNTLVDTVHKHFPTISIRLCVPERCLDSAAAFDRSVDIRVSTQQRLKGEHKLNESGANNESLYYSVVNALHAAAASGRLHWRHHAMALSFIRDLVHPNVHYDANVVRYALHALVHDSLDVRKLAVRLTIFILKQHKRKHERIEVEGEEEREQLRRRLCYDRDSRPVSAPQWDEPRYLHEHYSGWREWPKGAEVRIYAPTDRQPSVDRQMDELTDQEREIDAFFTSPAEVERLVRYLSLEEKKGRDKFNGYRFTMFKNLFRNTGDRYWWGGLEEHARRLAGSKEEQGQRCAAELIAAVARGSKHWPYEKVERLWRGLAPVVRSALDNMTVDTVADWGVCFATACENRDPHRQHWLYELLMDDLVLLGDRPSFIECGKLYALQGALNQQTWRVRQLARRLYDDLLRRYLDHPFQNVRDRVSSVLVNVYETDETVSFGNGTTCSSLHQPLRIEQFVREDVVPYLSCLERLQAAQTDAEDEGERAAVRLFKTACKWVIGCISRATFGAVPAFYGLFPLACLLQGCERDDELSSVCSSMLALLAQSLTLPEHVPAALDAVERVSQGASWGAREACAEFLQVFVFHNMATLSASDEWVMRIENAVLALLADERAEVRAMAGRVLGGLLHCRFLPAERHQALRERFSREAKARGALRARHGAVLGMCAFIDAQPYDVPDHLPSLFRELGAHLNDPQPIPTAIRKTMSDFKRTHYDNWQAHQLNFTEDELTVLADLNVPPSYYA